MTAPAARIDHLVVAAADLDAGEAWCQAQLGVPLQAGGEHPLMGTHNRLLHVASVDRPRAYLEVIAPRPGATPAGGRRRWFDMDGVDLQQSVSRSPRLIHFVVSVPDIEAALQAWAMLGIDRGPALAASRATDRGLLQWKISVRDDGARLFDGCLPTLIQWEGPHPIGNLEPRGVSLHGVCVTHPEAATLQAAFAAIGLADVEVTQGAPALTVLLRSPRGPVRLTSEVFGP